MEIDNCRPSCTNAWQREAHHVLCLAATKQVVLDPADLIMHDIRDLQKLRWRLQVGSASAAFWRRRRGAG